MKNVLITGVSRGLGLEIARHLLTKGYVVYGVSSKKNETIEDLLKKYSTSFFYKAFNLEEYNNIKDVLLKEFITKETRIDAFINNAAIAYDELITNLQPSELVKMYQINVISPILLTKFILRNFLLFNTKGSIVHISSISAHTGYKGLSMYASTKGAIEAFSKNCAREWGSLGIRSNCIAAGFMETDMSSSLDLQTKERIYKRTSLKKATDPKCVADTALFLINETSSSITGQTIFVDSGTI